MHLSSPDLAALPGVKHAFFTRRGGVSAGIYDSLNCGNGSHDAPASVAENRAIAARALGREPQKLITAYQVHSATAVIVDTPWKPGDAPQADALVTNVPGLVIGVLTADCLPVLLCDPQARVIAAVHSGWKGAFTGVIEASLAAMEQLGANRERIHAAIGPAIAQGSYEVGPEFHERFLLQDAMNNMFFIHSPREGHFLFDLKAYAKERMKNAGISTINILAEDTCLQEDDFFSYRRSCLQGHTDYGRQLSALVLT